MSTQCCAQQVEHQPKQHTATTTITMLDGSKYIPKEFELVAVTAADFNPQECSFDGSPFEPMADWIVPCADAGRLHISYDGRDYAVFDVITEHGLVIAEPDNKILYTEGKLYVVVDGVVVEGMDPVPHKEGTLHLSK